MVFQDFFACFFFLGVSLGKTTAYSPDSNELSYPTTFDCPMRQLALEFAQNIQPWLSADQLQEISDALNGSEEADDCDVKIDSFSNIPSLHRMPAVWPDLKDLNEINSIFVDFVQGKDENDGSITAPVKLIETAVAIARRRYRDKIKHIILREGRHYLPNTLYFTPEDSNLIITNFDGETVDVSGGQLLSCTWLLWKTGSNGKNYYYCPVNDTSIEDIFGLRVNGIRAIRARYPNANPETDGFGSNLTATWSPSTLPTKLDQKIHPSEPNRNDSVSGYFEYYNLGIGGPCEHFSPPAGYWCGSYKTPSGFTYNFPNAPFSNTSRMILQTWRPGHWFSWMFEIASFNSSSSKYVFSRGGFQGARGNDLGDEFYIENVIEELDSPGEYFYDTNSRKLFYYNNISGNDSTPDGLLFETTKLKVLMNFTGSQIDPIKNIIIRGVIFRDTQYTYMDDHGMPSGGDWALQRQGALYFEGTKDIIIEQNLFTRLDGNAISINGYNRNITVYRNEIVWNGDSGITAWGDTQKFSYNTSGEFGMGFDGTDGNQPRNINIVQNFVHEIGIWEKQSSLYFQAKSCQNYIYGNIFFNGPRAGINFNDGFGGGSRLVKNLLFNTCRESGDHGPFNSWDRQVYVTSVATGEPSVIKEYDHITQNFMIANYNSQEAVDNDDGSCYYKTYDNFFVYSGDGMKNDFGGHDNHHFNNIYAYVSKCFGINAQLVGHYDAFFNNTCVLTSAIADYGVFSCTDESTFPKLGMNIIHSVLYANGSSNTGLCNMDENAFQATYPGVDDGTVILGAANNTALLAQAKLMLWE